MTKYVKYVGTSHWREITEAQWAALDPPVEQVTLRWDAANGWTLPADRISDDAWPYVDADSELVVIDKDYRTSKPADDTGPADVKMYPPLVTAQQAELMDDEEASPQDGPIPAENNLPDQSSGSVSVDQEPVDNVDDPAQVSTDHETFNH